MKNLFLKFIIHIFFDFNKADMIFISKIILVFIKQVVSKFIIKIILSFLEHIINICFLLITYPKI